ncbi:unnamed protein product [Rotaria socialis]|uniref:Uncharacterized protein n=1 Tax=Rotaria socialis TaxID=392032 RepID=A0A817Z9H8_9BILA|nr:unnamed protein product [Rotaria socialis]CAF3391996.1 unnamed protein product [Rotaria socialis]CAF3462203.1 unnamed protein product [Rotaria socialis]CAF3528008.1 unnamed protein product [Rotaria socialis]CAF3589015.1 unnamed protein product [Rotaria socialis]
MANTIVIPYPTITTFRTPKRHQWRRYTTTMTINTNQKHHSSYSSVVRKSTSNLPDIINDCHNRRDDIINSNEEIKLMCKQIAHSLRLVADQVDKKYCQDGKFHRHIHCFTIRFVLHTTHIRTIIYTLWTRAFLPIILWICKAKSLF